MSDDHTRDDEDEKGGDDAADGGAADAGSPARPPTTVLGTILSGALERLQEGLSGTAEGGEAGQRLQVLAGRMLENMSKTRREREVARAAEALAKAEIGEDDGEDGGEVVDLTAAREAREARQSARAPIDIKAIVSQSVAAFVREHAEGEAPEKVTIDGDFVARHGSELVRAVVSSVGQAWFGAVTGASAEATESAAGSGESGAGDEAPAVDYDVLSILGGLLRAPTEGASSAGTGADQDADEDADDDDA